ncbi:MAG: sugar-binding domain-containing protein [Candidatus Aminicenantales bacterium]
MTRALRIVFIALLAVSAAAASAQTAPAVPAQTAVARPEYPRPEFVRSEWLNLNGPWGFAIDLSDTGEERGLAGGAGFDRTIMIPFAPESSLSGIGNLDFMAAVWYKRMFRIPESWKGRRVFLNFEAVDYKATVWINGHKAGEHEGGYTPFSLDITDALVGGDNTVIVRARDDTRSGLQPSGKQSTRFASYGCVYRRTTGIWQTVWLEPAPATRIDRYTVVADIDNGEADVRVHFNRAPAGGLVTVKIRFGGGLIASPSRRAERIVRFAVPIKDAKLWDVRKPQLYDLELVYERDGRIADAASGYFGLRKFEIEGNRFILNNRPFFLRLVLDQGFYPDGIYTAPSDAALRRDIELSMALGFDGARLHQRVFERRFLYWADKLGYIVWGEFADWGLDLARPEAFLVFSREWSEAVERDLGHPALIGWCPFNEQWGGHFPGLIPEIFKLTKRLDPSRPVIDASGGRHYAVPDVYDAHDYDQDPVRFKERFDGLLAVPPKIFVNGGPEHNTPYAGQPYFVSEYGGIWWNPDQQDDKAWGYGERPRSEAEFLDRYKKLTEALLFNPAVAGFCYTQLTNVEQEVNGLLTFDRQPKFDPALIKAVNQQKAAVEK